LDQHLQLQGLPSGKIGKRLHSELERSTHFSWKNATKNRLGHGFHSYVFPLPGWVKTMAHFFSGECHLSVLELGCLNSPDFVLKNNGVITLTSYPELGAIMGK